MHLAYRRFSVECLASRDSDDGHISRRGDAHFRGLLHEAATVILTRTGTDSSLRSWRVDMRRRHRTLCRAVAINCQLSLAAYLPIPHRSDGGARHITGVSSKWILKLTQWKRMVTVATETTLFPGELVLGQSAARIVDRNFVRNALAPFPKHEILIRRRRARRKTRNKNSSSSGVD